MLIAIEVSGCDQILLVEPPTAPNVDFRYRIFNADGSEVAQCGNGARCFAKFVRDQKLSGKTHLKVETHAGILELYIDGSEDITVELGLPIFEPGRIPFKRDKIQTLYRLNINDTIYQLSALSLGNPHAVLEVDDIASAPVTELGRQIESHPDFPEKVNVGFMEILSRRKIKLRVYERGAGETQACGSGACAAVVAGIGQDLLDSPVTVYLNGGQLDISWLGEGQTVAMTGPATTVFQGRIKI